MSCCLVFRGVVICCFALTRRPLDLPFHAFHFTPQGSLFSFFLSIFLFLLRWLCVLRELSIGFVA